MNKEQVYDQQINPLMENIIAICKTNKIAMLATFDIPTEEDSGLMCTTHLPDESGELPERIKQMRSYSESEECSTIYDYHAASGWK